MWNAIINICAKCNNKYINKNENVSLKGKKSILVNLNKKLEFIKQVPFQKGFAFFAIGIKISEWSKI